MLCCEISSLFVWLVVDADLFSEKVLIVGADLF
jgi:hypothetical protein